MLAECDGGGGLRQLADWAFLTMMAAKLAIWLKIHTRSRMQRNRAKVPPRLRARVRKNNGGKEAEGGQTPCFAGVGGSACSQDLPPRLAS